MKIKFFGAAQCVTGSKHLITTDSGKRILLDCGMFQGKTSNRENLNRVFGFEPSAIDFLILSHAHIDHSGLIPRLVNEGFTGKIFATPATIDLCGIMLMDSAHIQHDDVKYLNKRRIKKHEPLLEPLYDTDDVQQALKLMVPVNYNQKFVIDKDVTLLFTDAGHLLGSTIVNLTFMKKDSSEFHLTFSGDLGKYNDPILCDPQPFPQCDFLLCESTYGDRLHPQTADTEKLLLDVIKKTCLENHGKLIIPAFSVDRTQEMIYAIDKMYEEKKIPALKIFVDSPLSVKATGVIEKHKECYNQEFISYISSYSSPFHFKNLIYVSDVEQSKKLNDLKEPCIIISASGMAEAGRIKHHIKNNIGNPRNTILFVGYCTPESLGGKLRNGEKVVRIFGEEYPVKAGIEVMDYYSAHADYEGIFKILECQDKKKLKQIFLVHGEKEVQEHFKTKFIERGYSCKIDIPKIGDEFEI
ncbi:MAG: MBL fold metallo-hydrolase RNA specificity domain-containing protein [Bacteroidia bacterium]